MFSMRRFVYKRLIKNTGPPRAKHEKSLVLLWGDEFLGPRRWFFLNFLCSSDLTRVERLRLVAGRHTAFSSSVPAPAWDRTWNITGGAFFQKATQGYAQFLGYCHLVAGIFLFLRM
jgi:hypothetical protein